MRDIHELQEAIHTNARDKGWWDKPRNFGEIVALCHSELSEALESWRDGEPLRHDSDDGKPEGAAVEMADCVIRILDWAASEGVDLGQTIEDKHAYNTTRQHRHGGKRA